jgi:hypothetical protein
MSDLDAKIRENSELRQNVQQQQEYIERTKERLMRMEQEKDDMIQKLNQELVTQSIELKDKMSREKNGHYEQLSSKLKIYERDMRDLYSKNQKLEESCSKYQDVTILIVLILASGL